MKNLQTTPSGRYLDSNISPALTALLASLLSLASADSPTKQPRPGNRGHGKRAPSLAGFAEGGAGVEHPAQAPGVRAVAEGAQLRQLLGRLLRRRHVDQLLAAGTVGAGDTGHVRYVLRAEDVDELRAAEHLERGRERRGPRLNIRNAGAIEV